MRYHSKKDLVLVAPLWVALVLPFLLGIGLLRPGSPGGFGWVTFFVVLAVDLLVVALTFPMYYEITSTILLVRSGLVRVEIPLEAIEQVFPDRTLGSAPAWSLDRLRVDYRKGRLLTFVHIAPKDKFAFMQDLAEHAPGLQVKDGRVVRGH